MTENLPQGNPLAHDLDTIIATMGDGWEAYRGARIFLTGGTGFFGRWFLESFHRANRHHALGATLTVLSRNGDAFARQVPHLMGDGAIRFHLGDVRHFAFPEGAFTHILHAAAESSGGTAGHDALHMADTIIGGTRRVLDFAQEAGAGRVLCLSSGAVYGRWRAAAEPIAEDDRSAPLVTDGAIAYDESKRMAEALCMLYHRERGVPVTVARGFSFVGPHLPRDGHFAIGNFIRDALAGGDIRLSGDGSAVRSYLYMADAMVWLWTLLARGEAGQAYNVGSGEAVTVAALAHKVQQVLAAPGKVVLGKAEPTELQNYQVPDVARAQALGLCVSVPLDEAIRRTAAWYRTHPEPARGAQEPLVLARPDVVVFDFDGVMTDNRVIVREDGREAVLCNRSDGLGIGMLKKRGVPMLVLSTEANPVVGVRCRKLGLECLQGIAVKEQALAQWLAERGYDPARTIYLGNDINDLGCLKLVGLPVVVGDAYDAVKPLARIILRKHGGKGAVRELCDRILAAAEGV